MQGGWCCRMTSKRFTRRARRIARSSTERDGADCRPQRKETSLYRRPKVLPHRCHGRAWPGHPRLYCVQHSKTWVPGPSPAMTQTSRNLGPLVLLRGPPCEPLACHAAAPITDPARLSTGTGASARPEGVLKQGKPQRAHLPGSAGTDAGRHDSFLQGNADHPAAVAALRARKKVRKQVFCRRWTQMDADGPVQTGRQTGRQTGIPNSL